MPLPKKSKGLWPWALERRYLVTCTAAIPATFLCFPQFSQTVSDKSYRVWRHHSWSLPHCSTEHRRRPEERPRRRGSRSQTVWTSPGSHPVCPHTETQMWVLYHDILMCVLILQLKHLEISQGYTMCLHTTTYTSREFTTIYNLTQTTYI